MEGSVEWNFKFSLLDTVFTMKKYLDIDEPLSPGDVVELHFKTIGLAIVQAAQLAAIESNLEGAKEFTVLRHSYDFTGDKIIQFQVRIEKTNPAVVTVALIVFLIKLAAIGVLCWLIFEGAYKIVEGTGDIIESPAGAAAAGGIGLLLVIIALSALLAFFGRHSK